MRDYSTQISVVEVQSSALCARTNGLCTTSAGVDRDKTDRHLHCTFRRMRSGCVERTNEPRLDAQQRHHTADRSIAEYNRGSWYHHENWVEAKASQWGKTKKDLVV